MPHAEKAAAGLFAHKRVLTFNTVVTTPSQTDRRRTCGFLWGVCWCAITQTRTQLEALAKEKPQQFKLFYTVDRPAAGWTHGVGFITAEMIETHLPPPAETTQILMCGPPPMIKFACQANLDQLGYSKESQTCF